MKVDDELRRACVDIFNDAMAEFQAESGQRIFPMALMPWWDVKLAVKEIERAKRMGLRGININSDPHTFTTGDGTKLPDLVQRVLVSDVGSLRGARHAGELPYRRVGGVDGLDRLRRVGLACIAICARRSAARCCSSTTAG